MIKKRTGKIFKLLALTAAFTIGTMAPAFACLSCSCGSSGSSADMGALGGMSGLFSKNRNFLFQYGSSFRTTDGSFNEKGTWNPLPTDSYLYGFQNTLSMMYFPDKNMSIGLQLPVVSNFLSNASWGEFGSIAPTDTGRLSGTSLGDINAQFTYKLLELNNFALAGWLRSEFPTGVSRGNVQDLSGGGLFKLSGGLFSLYKLGRFELMANAGYQQPFNGNSENNNPFYIGNAFLYQLSGNYQLTGSFKAGLGINGFVGRWLSSGNSENSMLASKIKLLGSMQYELTMYNGIGLGIGIDPRFGGSNATTDNSLNLVFYQYM